MKAAIILVATALAAGLPAIAQDATPNAAQETTQGTPLSSIIAGLEGQGYTVTDLDVDRNEIEAEAITSGGERVELRLDPATGAILDENPDD